MVMATMADAHSEWHRNTGVPMGTPGCPQDACHPIEDFAPFHEMYPEAIKCGNRKAHPAYDRESGTGYHFNAAEVRECFARSSHNLPGPAQREGEAGSGTPSRQDARPDWSAIPVGEKGYGFYALEGQDGTVTSYRVQQLRSGKTFARRFVSDTLYPVADFVRVLSAIARDSEAAGMLYALHNVRCVKCNRKLTDEESKARGMGPVCWDKGGWK